MLNHKQSESTVARGRRTNKEQVVRALETFCASLLPGDRVPTHTELMRLLNASERAVHSALNELQRQGKIIRKNGVGTFVAEPSSEGFDKAYKTIVVIARPDHSFFDRFLDLLFRHCEAADLNLVCQPVEDANNTSGFLSATLRPLGYLLFGDPLSPLAKRLQNEGNRVVLVGAPAADALPDVPRIYNDHEHGGYLTTKHLIELGHRRIAYAYSGIADLQQSRRWRGHQRAIQEARRSGVLVEVTFLLQAELDAWEKEPGRATAFFAPPDAPTSLVAWNDHEAIHLLSMLTRAGVSVPDQVSLVGYDALPEGNRVYPSLTTVDHGMRQQLVAAVDLLTRTTPIPPTHTLVFMPTLVIRESTAHPPL